MEYFNVGICNPCGAPMGQKDDLKEKKQPRCLSLDSNQACGQPKQVSKNYKQDMET